MSIKVHIGDACDVLQADTEEFELFGQLKKELAYCIFSVVIVTDSGHSAVIA